MILITKAASNARDDLRSADQQQGKHKPPTDLSCIFALPRVPVLPASMLHLSACFVHLDWTSQQTCCRCYSAAAAAATTSASAASVTHFSLLAAGVYAGDSALRTATHISSFCSVKILKVT
jgi:hypothetical protein